MCVYVCAAAMLSCFMFMPSSCTCNKDKAIWYKNFLIACTNDALQQLDRNYNEANKTPKGERETVRERAQLAKFADEIN